MQIILHCTVLFATEIKTMYIIHRKQQRLKVLIKRIMFLTNRYLLIFLYKKKLLTQLHCFLNYLYDKNKLLGIKLFIG